MFKKNIQNEDVFNSLKKFHIKKKMRVSNLNLIPYSFPK